MGVLNTGLSALGKLLIALSLLATFLAGMLGVVYYQLRGEEVSIPKVVGKNFNEGRDDLSGVGLRIKKIATRYSNEEPNTILEQRPRAGSTAKSGLMISVVVSEANPDGRELPTEVKDDEEVIGEIEQQPELKIDKQKTKKSKKTSPKTRDVIKPEPEEEKSDEALKATDSDSVPGPQGSTKPEVKPEDSAPKQNTTPKPAAKPPVKPPADQKPKPKPDDN